VARTSQEAADEAFPPFEQMLNGSAASAAGRRSRVRTSMRRASCAARNFVGSPEQVVDS
jgi:hypothetical protein